MPPRAEPWRLAAANPKGRHAVDMKMVVAYIDRDTFEPIREDLLERGFLSLSVLEASGSLPEPLVAGTYRGVPVERHLRPKARIECVVGSSMRRRSSTPCSSTP